ncbi:carbohydrate-binding module family 24 protein [Parathielavia hyrcaniae]|uniref:Carbohydrate-binding module family 24 protein n=1 Tax=Parathielavia hyrcaniae TaxID=113614 RepID=A0AAN6SWW2_9PEZI|nr:carbohydrate-binding module family 24 protein [Parathielavia hyrcaniae]
MPSSLKKPCPVKRVLVIVTNARGSMEATHLVREEVARFICDGYLYEVEFVEAEHFTTYSARWTSGGHQSVTLIFTYDASSRQSWDEVAARYTEIRWRCENMGVRFPTMILAMDDGFQEPIFREDAKAFASRWACLFTEYSPTTGRGLCDAFTSLVEQMHNARDSKQPPVDGSEPAKVAHAVFSSRNLCKSGCQDALNRYQYRFSSRRSMPCLAVDCMYEACFCSIDSSTVLARSTITIMRFLAALTSVLAYFTCLAKAQAVFAHFMVGNTKAFGLDDWKREIRLAQQAGIDAFALNMANNDATNNIALPLAFDAAASRGFKLFFSFDHAGNGAWAKTVVRSMIDEYGVKPAHFKRGSQPFVSTFEGPENAADWTWIKAQTKCFFIPDWSSIGAQPAVRLADGVADGLFSWDAWPKGPANMTTYPDASYYDFLGSKPYMMLISPWFYTNLPGYGKNWLWRGDDMWFQRWQQAITIDRRPDYIQIISWNDFGESHYIGPLDERQYDAILTSRDAQVQVSIGGVVQQGGWDQEPHGGVGVYHGSVPMGSATGPVVVTLKRGGTAIATVNGASITNSCTNGLNNYNAWVGSGSGPVTGTVAFTGDTAELKCVKGFGVYEFTGVCDFACANGYCPSAACTFLRKGLANPPNETGVAGYPLPGKSGSFKGLCSFDCNHGYCPDTVCGRTPNDGVVLNYSPFLPPACTGGTGAGAFAGLCDFGCRLGFCPIHVCTCTATGVLVQTPHKTNVTGYYLDSSVDDHGLCKFAVEHGYQPDVCGKRPIGDNVDPGKYLTVTLDPRVWSAPTIQCPPPCVFVFPPTVLPSPTTISFNLWPTSLEYGWTTTESVGGRVTTRYVATTITTVLTIPPLTTNRISYSDALIKTTVDGGLPLVVVPTPSVNPPPFVITPHNLLSGITASPVPRTIHPPPWPWTGHASPQPTGSSSSSSPLGGIVIIPTGPFPTAVFPTETISWVTNWVSEPTTTEVNGAPVPVIPCWVWFIWVCPPGFGGVVLWGFRLPGIYPIGGPPRIGPGPLPPGVTLKLPWPQITIGLDLKPTYSRTPNPDETYCESATAEICTTTLSYGVVAKRNVAAATQAPRVPFEEFAAFKFAKRAITTTTSTISFCTRVQGCGATDITETTSVAATAVSTPRVVIPRDPMNVAGIRDAIQQQPAGTNSFFESRTDQLGTNFFFLHASTDAQTDAIRGNSLVREVYIPKGIATAQDLSISKTGGGRLDNGEQFYSNHTTKQERAVLSKRAEKVDPGVPDVMALLSWPPNTGVIPYSGGDCRYDDSAGSGTYVYSCDYGVTPTHPEFSDIASFTPLFPGPFRVADFKENDRKWHGTLCLSKAVGKTVGIARKARVVATVSDFNTAIYEHYLDGLALIHEDIYIKGRGTKTDRMGRPYGYPALFGDPSNRNYIPNLIVVGSVLGEGIVGGQHSDAPWVTCYAPGYSVRVATSDPKYELGGLYRSTGGTSLASATVAGLAAYFRGLDPTLTTAVLVKERILALAYARQRRPGRSDTEYAPDTVIWNGQQNGGSIVRACSGGNTKRQSGGSCPVQHPPNAPTFTFRTGSAEPTCVSGAACGSSCKGFFCQGNPLPQNPDFLDPRNPGSVQNPTGPYYGDWDGTINRPSSTRTPTSTTSTARPKPTGPTPAPGHGDSTPTWSLIYYELRDSRGQSQDFYGYDDSANTNCQPEPATWKNSCRFSSSDMMLRCDKWAPATCVDRRSGPNYGGGGTCKVDYAAGIYQYWQAILLCEW